MKSNHRPLSLLISLLLCSFALSAVTTTKSCAVSAAVSDVQAFPFSGIDASVPSASTVIFPAAEETSAPTF